MWAGVGCSSSCGSEVLEDLGTGIFRYFIPCVMVPASPNQAPDLGPAGLPGWMFGCLWGPATLTILALGLVLGVLSCPLPSGPLAFTPGL